MLGPLSIKSFNLSIAERANLRSTIGSLKWYTDPEVTRRRNMNVPSASDLGKRYLEATGAIVVAVSGAAFLALRFVSSDQVRVFIWSGERPPSIGSWRVCMQHRLPGDLATYRPLVSAIAECIEPTYVSHFGDLHIGRWIALGVVLVLYYSLVVVGRHIFNSVLMAVIFAVTVATSSMVIYFGVIGLSGVAAPLALAAAAASASKLQSMKSPRHKTPAKGMLSGALYYLVGLSLFPAWAMTVFIFTALALVWNKQIDRSKLIGTATVQGYLLLLTAAYIGAIKLLNLLYQNILDVKVDAGAYRVQLRTPIEFVHRFFEAMMYQLHQPYLGLFGMYGMICLTLASVCSPSVIRSCFSQSSTKNSRILAALSMIILAVSSVVALVPTLVTSIPLTAHKVAPLLFLVATGVAALTFHIGQYSGRALTVAFVVIGVTGLWAGQRVTATGAQSAWELNRLEHGAKSWLLHGVPSQRTALIVIPPSEEQRDQGKFSSLRSRHTMNYQELALGPGDTNRFFPALMGVFRRILPNSAWPLNFTYSAEDALRISELVVSVSDDPIFFCDEKAFTVDLRNGSIGIPAECNVLNRP